MNFTSAVNYCDTVPNEIFLHIFKNLPLEDRRSIRCTCRRFYELCNDFFIQTTEFFVLYGIPNPVSALDCLSRTSRRIPNIILSRMRLDAEIVSPFFEQQGAYVRSLVLMDCSFYPGALKTMIEYCVNLNNFVLDFRSGNQRMRDALDDFDDLETNSVVRDSVTGFSLIMQSVCWWISNRTIFDIFAVFPKIKKLNLKIPVGDKNEFLRARQLFHETSKHFFTYACIYDRLLALADQLEVLKLNFGCRIPGDIFNVRMKNLKQLSWFSDDGKPDISFIQNSCLFEKLTHFNCSVCIPSSYIAHESELLFFQRLLQFTPLRTLSITSTIFMGRKLFQALVASKLIGLHIYGVSEGMDLWSTYDPQNTLSPNYHLQHLVIDKCDRKWTLRFATYFRNLKRLKFDELHHSVLWNIFKDQTQIFELHLRDLTGRELSYFQDWLREKEPISRELKYLTELRIAEKKYSLTEFLLGEFVFPRLKSLYINIQILDESTELQLCYLISKLPKLESLTLDLPTKMNFSQRPLFQGLPKLRHFHFMNDDSAFTLSEYRQLFHVFPSLRTIAHVNRDGPWFQYGSRYYFYDVIEKTVVDVEARCGSSAVSDFFHCFSPLLGNGGSCSSVQRQVISRLL